MLSAVAPPIRILPLGDSITDGAGVPGSYRAPLYQLLTNAGYNVDFVGLQKNNGVAGLPDSDHEGHSGWRIDQIDSIIQGVFEQVADPDVILVLIGTNDYGQGYDTAHATNRFEALMAKMAIARPYAKIIAANLLVRGEPLNSQIQSTFNPFLPSLVARQRSFGREIYFDDLRSAVPLSNMPDQLHPDLTGCKKMATNWFGVITNLFSPEGSTNAPALARAYTMATLTNVVVVFSKPVEDGAAAMTNFSLSGGVTVHGAALDSVSRREVTLVTTSLQPSTAYTLTVNGVQDRTKNRLPIAPNASIAFRTSPGRGASNNVPEAANYTLVYSLNIPHSPNYSGGLTYDLDRRAEVSGFSRIAYYLELQQTGGPLNFIWASMDPFTNNVNAIGVPTVSSAAVFQRPVANLTVFSSVAGIVNGTNLAGGNLEFWPSNYSAANSANVPNASATVYDWGDSPTPGNYGSMQIHNAAAKQVLFAFNRWGGAGGTADLGIGNRSGNYLDWTFTQNAANYAVKTLQVLVLPALPQIRVMAARFQATGQFSVSWEATPGTSYSILKKQRLDSTAWTKAGVVTAASNSAGFIDSQATNETSFYRITAP